MMRGRNIILFMGIFLLVFGGIFVAVGIAIVSKEAEGLIPLLVGVAVAAAGISVIIYQTVSRMRERNIVKNGADGIGTFIDAFSNVSVNGVPYYCVKFLFEDETGRAVTVKTAAKFGFDEAECYRAAGQFKIKYIGTRAVIAQSPQDAIAVLSGVTGSQGKLSVSTDMPEFSVGRLSGEFTEDPFADTGEIAELEPISMDRANAENNSPFGGD